MAIVERQTAHFQKNQHNNSTVESKIASVKWKSSAGTSPSRALPVRDRAERSSRDLILVPNEPQRGKEGVFSGISDICEVYSCFRLQLQYIRVTSDHRIMKS